MNETAPTWTVYRARWLMLALYSLITLVLQLQWLTFAPIAREAQAVYEVGPFAIDLLSLIFMLVFVVVGLPASWLIDRFGIRVGVGLGAVLTGAFGLLKGVGAASYATVVVAQVGLAVAQPLVINAVTKVAAQWFPIGERATAVGIATLAQFLGIIVAMVVTPELVDHTGATPDLGPMLVAYGVVSAAVSVLVLALLREHPPTPPGPERTEEHLVTWRGMRRIFAQRDMRLVIALFFIGLGVFNAVSTCIDQLCGPKGLDADETGLVGGVMLIAGVVGAAILPAISDKLRKRRPFLILAMALATPAIAALTLAEAFLPLVVASAVLGVFLLGAGAPIGFQYAAEVSYPVAESLSQGVILLAGQISGILFIVGVNVLGITPMMWLFVALMAVALGLAGALRESPRILLPGDQG